MVDKTGLHLTTDGSDVIIHIRVRGWLLTPETDMRKQRMYRVPVTRMVVEPFEPYKRGQYVTIRVPQYDCPDAETALIRTKQPSPDDAWGVVVEIGTPYICEY